MVAAAPNAGAQPSINAVIEPVSANGSLRFRETGFLGPEIKVQILAPQSPQPLCRDRARAAPAAKSGPLASGREISLDGGLRGGGRSRSRTRLHSPIPC